MEQKFSEFSKFRGIKKSLKHELGSFKDLGTVVGSWFLTQEVAGLIPFNCKYLLTELEIQLLCLKELANLLLSAFLCVSQRLLQETIWQRKRKWINFVQWISLIWCLFILVSDAPKLIWTKWDIFLFTLFWGLQRTESNWHYSNGAGCSNRIYLGASYWMNYLIKYNGYGNPEAQSVISWIK